MVPITAQLMVLALTPTEALLVAVMKASMVTVWVARTMTNAHLLLLHATRAQSFALITLIQRR